MVRVDGLKWDYVVKISVRSLDIEVLSIFKIIL